MKRILCLILTALAVFLSACSGESTENKTGETAKEAVGGSITIYSLKDDTLCPILTDNDANRQMLGIVYEPLIRLKSNMEAEGVLAESWSVSEDGLNWTFNLRNGVKWHSGEDFTAQDVVYTVNLIKSNPGSIYESNVRFITDAKAESGKVIFTLSEPCANFVNLMTFPVIKQQTEEIDRLSYIPYGTGAYVFSDKNEGNMYYLKRNESWWGGKGKLDEIKVKLLPDSETVMYSFSAGDIDIANAERGQQGRFSGNTNVRTTSCDLSVYNFVGINHNNIVLAQPEIRQAMDKVIKRSKIIDDIYAGNAEAVRSPMRKNWFVSGDAEEDYEADTGEAERILLKAQWKKTDGVYRKEIENKTYKAELDLIVNEDNVNRRNMAESVKLDLENAGIAVNIIPLPYEEYESKIASGDYELFMGSVMISDELDYRYLLGTGNMFGYKNEDMDNILAATQSARGKEKIVEAYGKFRKKFDSELPIIGICFENSDILYSAKVGGELMSAPGSIYDGIYNLYIKEQKNG